MYSPFSTEMERSICIDKLKKGNKFPESVLKHWPNEVLNRIKLNRTRRKKTKINQKSILFLSVKLSSR